jgi:hypothetical protein
MMEPQKPLEEWTTPALVREYADVRVHAVRLAFMDKKLNADQHAWKCAVVDELRSRGVLD